MARKTKRLGTVHHAPFASPFHNRDIGTREENADLLSPQRQAQWLLAFLLVGLAARTVRYMLRFPLWEDEAMLAANFLDRGFWQMLKPLNYVQVAPTLFLWSELAVVKVFGFSEYALRLVPFVCGIASLFLFRHLAGLLLRGTALVIAFGVFAVSYPPIRYAAEAKPYACDLFLALAMLTLAVHWLRRPGENRWLWALAAMILPAVGFSFPALFTGGGVSLVVGYTLWRSGRRGWLPWFAFNLLLAGGFLAVLAVNHFAVGQSNQAEMDRMWQDSFPPLAHPIQLIAWFFSEHTGSMLAYPVGGPRGGSTAAFLCCAAGLVVFARRRQGWLLALLLLPLGLNFVAAAMHRYPYPQHMKFGLFSAATFCILMGAGIAAMLDWLARRGKRGQSPFVPSTLRALPANEDSPLFPRVAARIVLIVLVLVAGGLIVHDLIYPYKSETTLRARDFARWFWFDVGHDSELVCLETDWKKDLSPGTYTWGWSSLYLCNQRIYSPRHARGESPHLERVSAERPLRCVLFRALDQEKDSGRVDRWVDEMERSYKLVCRDRYPVPIYGKWGAPSPADHDYIEVFKFVPLEGKRVKAPLSLRERGTD